MTDGKIEIKYTCQIFRDILGSNLLGKKQRKKAAK